MAAVVAEPLPPRTGRERTSRTRRVRSLAGWVGVVLLVLAWAVTLRPTQLGGPATFIVVSGDSMEPTLHSGDLVVLRAQSTYDIGDIATFPVPEGQPGEGTLVIHRIVGAEGERWVPQGDNRDRVDEWRPTDDDVRGELWLHVPRGGEMLVKALQPPLLAALFGGGVTMWILLRDSPPRNGTTHEDDHES